VLACCIVALTAVAVAKSFAVRAELYLSTAVALAHSRVSVRPIALLHIGRADSFDVTAQAALVIFLRCRMKVEHLACVVTWESEPTRRARVEVEAVLHMVGSLCLSDDSNHGLHGLSVSVSLF